MLKNGFETERLQYSRIGLPFYDLKEVLNNTDNNEDVIPDIMNWIITEYHAVHKLIQEKTQGGEK